jgi:hypothetical protein
MLNPPPDNLDGLQVGFGRVKSGVDCDSHHAITLKVMERSEVHLSDFEREIHTLDKVSSLLTDHIA